MSHAAHAQSAGDSVRVALLWHGAGDSLACLDPKLLAKRVESQLGHAVFVAPSSADADVELKIDVTARASASDVDVELELLRRAESLGSRSLQGSTDKCAALLDSLVVVVALLVDVPREPEPPPAPLLEDKPAPLPPVAREAPSVAPRTPTSAALGAHATAMFGLLPSAALGVGFDLRVAFGFAPSLAWRLGADFLPRDRLRNAGGRVAFSAQSLQVGFAPLRFGSKATLNAEPWLLAAADALEAQGSEFASNAGGVRWLPAAGLSLRAELPVVGGLALTAEGALWLQLQRPRFLYQDGQGQQSNLHRPAALVPALDWGAVWRF